MSNDKRWTYYEITDATDVQLRQICALRDAHVDEQRRSLYRCLADGVLSLWGHLAADVGADAREVVAADYERFKQLIAAGEDPAGGALH